MPLYQWKKPLTWEDERKKNLVIFFGVRNFLLDMFVPSRVMSIKRKVTMPNINRKCTEPHNPQPRQKHGISSHTSWNIWVFPKIGVSQNGWFIMENPIKMDDLGVPLFLETPISWSWPNMGVSHRGVCCFTFLRINFLKTQNAGLDWKASGLKTLWNLHLGFSLSL